MITKSLSSLRPVSLFIALVLAASGPAFAGKSTAKLAGTFSGNYNASGAISGAYNFTGSSSGPSTAAAKAIQGKKGLKLKLSGTDTQNSGGGTYSATVKFKDDGTATTTAIVPGVVNIGATGTWKLKGKTIKFKFQAALPVGTIDAKGSIKVAGNTMTIQCTGTANSPIAFGSGQYSFSGTK